MLPLPTAGTLLSVLIRAHAALRCCAGFLPALRSALISATGHPGGIKCFQQFVKVPHCSPFKGVALDRLTSARQILIAVLSISSATRPCSLPLPPSQLPVLQPHISHQLFGDFPFFQLSLIKACLLYVSFFPMVFPHASGFCASLL